MQPIQKPEEQSADSLRMRESESPSSPYRFSLREKSASTVDTSRFALSSLLAQSSHLPALDGMRALAISVVIVYHLGTVFFPVYRVPGDLGVSFFFVLSGFLITWLLLKEWDKSGTIWLRGFYVRRVLRIFPAYYVFVTIWLIGRTILRGKQDSLLVLSAFGYVMNYYNAFNDHPSTGIAHTWSLAIEEQFYLLWPALFLLFLRWGRQTLIWGLIALILAVASWRTFVYNVLDWGRSYAYDAFDTRFDSLAIGCLLAALLSNGTLDRAAKRVTLWAGFPLITISLLLWSRMGTSDVYHYGPGFTVDALLMAVLIVQMLQLSAHPCWRWLNNPIVRYLGIISYPLYLYHESAIMVAARLPSFVPSAGKLLLAISGSISAASLSYFCVERPFLRLKSAFAPRVRRQKEQETTTKNDVSNVNKPTTQSGGD
jgi:peptidoglycan/LPS O-acetylase OafA/YrhL